jgi:hypothetical protein
MQVRGLLPCLLFHPCPTAFAHHTQEVAKADENKQDEESHRKKQLCSEQLLHEIYKGAQFHNLGCWLCEGVDTPSDARP